MTRAKPISLFFVVACLVISLPVFAGSLGNIQLGNSVVSNLLDDRDIHCVERDRSGILWICTQQGLYRYDGNNLVRFSPLNRAKHHISSYNTRQVYIGMAGAIFAVTYGGGVSIYDSVTENFSPLFRHPNQLKIHTLVEAQDGQLWFTSLQGGVASYNLATQKFQKWLETDEINSTIAFSTSIIATPSGEIWFGGKKGLYRVQPNRKRIELFSPSQDDKLESSAFSVRAILQESENIIIFGTKSGRLGRFNTTQKRFMKEHLLRDSELISINDVELFFGKIWVATDSGLIAIDQKSNIVTRYSQQDSKLSNNDVQVLSIDKQQLWVGTYFGLDFLSSSSFAIYDTANSGVENEIMSFSEDLAGRLWVSTYNGVYFKPKNSERHHSINKLFPEVQISDERVMSSEVIGNTLWLGLRGAGVHLVNLQDGTDTKPDMGTNSEVPVTTILKTSNHESWVGTHKSGLYRFKNRRLITHYGRDVFSNFFDLEDVVTALHETKNGTMLIGTETGLLKLNPRTNVFSKIEINSDSSLTIPIILSVTQDQYGGLWVGTLNHGLLFSEHSNPVDLAEFVSVVTDISVYSIVIDNVGHLWVSTSQGLIRLDTKGNILEEYSVANGLQGNDFNYGASYKDSQGRIYFGGSNGYNRFDPERVSIKSNPPPVVLTNLKIAGDTPSLPVSLQALEKFQLSHTDYFFTISFSALDFLNPSKNQYSYMLENFDEDWIDNGTSNSATYTNLPAGDYTFRVRGANSAGVWNLEGASIDVQVLPAPWFSWWALLCYALATLAAMYYAKRIYDSRLLARNLAIRAEQMQHAADRANDDLQERLEIQDELVRSVYKHNMNTLDLVKSLHSVRADYLSDPTLADSFENDQNRLVALSYLESCVLYQDEVLYADLNKYTDLVLGLALESSRTPVESITTINDVSKKMVPVEIATPLAMVIFELVDNSVSHAFEPDSPANYLQISLDTQFNIGSQSHQLSLVVKDDGVGLPSEIPKEELESTGLAFVRSVVDKLHGELTISGSNPGTKIEVLVPNTADLVAPYGHRP